MRNAACTVPPSPPVMLSEPVRQSAHLALAASLLLMPACGPKAQDDDAPPTDDLDCRASPDEDETIAGGTPGPSGFPPPCSPRQTPGIDGFRCCSDDPATIDGAAPDFDGQSAGAITTIFSGPNNDESSYGICVRVADIPAGAGLASGCPIPCNPTWDEAKVTAVCGTKVCCQTVELQPEDCVHDGTRFRPVTGVDVQNDLTQWSPTSHATHQDPNGLGCDNFAGGDADIGADCVGQLSVANQRGFCISVTACPLDPNDIDACEAMN